MKKNMRWLFSVLSLAGCATIGSTSNVTVNKRAGYSQQIDEVFVAIKIDGIPQTFSIPFVSNLQSDLQSRGVKADVKAISELDLDPVKEGDIEKHHYIMVCIPTKTFSDQYALRSVTMNCTLSETEKKLVVMKADATANKGWGFGFGENEAQHVAQKLIDEMEGAGLIDAQLSVPLDVPAAASRRQGRE